MSEYKNQQYKRLRKNRTRLRQRELTENKNRARGSKIRRISCPINDNRRNILIPRNAIKVRESQDYIDGRNPKL